MTAPSTYRRCPVCEWVGPTWRDGKRMATHAYKGVDGWGPRRCEGVGRVGTVGRPWGPQ